MKITYLFPSRERPEKLFKRLEEITTLSNTGEYDVILVLDSDDETMNNDSVKSRLQFFHKVSVDYGVSENKVHACNRCVDKATGDVIVLHSDDMVITKKGFDNDIREAAQDFTGLIHFPDLRVDEKLCTYPILTKDYVAVDGYIYNPNFKSVYCDNFQMDLAKSRSKYKYVDKKIIRHEHYRGGYGLPDALMDRNDSPLMYLHDRAVYLSLKKEFGLL